MHRGKKDNVKDNLNEKAYAFVSDLLARGELDTERMARILLEEFRSGKIGKFTLELPEGTEETTHV